MRIYKTPSTLHRTNTGFEWLCSSRERPSHSPSSFAHGTWGTSVLLTTTTTTTVTSTTMAVGGRRRGFFEFGLLKIQAFGTRTCSLMILRELAAHLGSGETLLRSTEEAKIDLIPDCAPSKFDSCFLSIEANNLEIFVSLNISWLLNICFLGSWIFFVRDVDLILLR